MALALKKLPILYLTPWGYMSIVYYALGGTILPNTLFIPDPLGSHVY